MFSAEEIETEVVSVVAVRPRPCGQQTHHRCWESSDLLSIPLQLSSPAAPTAQPKAPPSKAPPSGSAPIAKAAPKGTSTRGRYGPPHLGSNCLAVGGAAPADTPVPTAQQQLAFLEGRKKQLLQAALRAKQKNDVEGAKMHLRQAKGLEPMLEASCVNCGWMKTQG